MKDCFSLLSSVLLLALMFSGCEPADEPISSIPTDAAENTAEENLPIIKSQESDPPAYFIAQLEKYESTVINTYTVNFLGRTATGAGETLTTTFKYRVTGGGETPQLDSFTLELPGCSGGLVSSTPEKASNLHEDAIKWNNSVSKDGSQEYSLTFKGDIPLGVISSTVTRGSISETKDVIGPCKGVFTLSGSIYIDANGDKLKQASESGIASFLIDLYDANNEKIATVPTLEDGSYSFLVLKGDYRIAVNGDLLNDNNYTAVGDTSFIIENIQADESGYNFGYSINSLKIIEELEEKIIVVNTEPTKFWVQQIRHAGKKGSLYTKEEIRGFLTTIETLLLAEPFYFGTDKEANALSILANPIRTELDAFLQQLLTAELNIVSGRGAIDPQTKTLNTGFNSALLIYSEAVACRDLGNCPAETEALSRTAQVKASSNDTRMLSSFNGSGGV